MKSPLVITRGWETVAKSNPKYARMLRRRGKILRNLRGYRRQVDLLESLLRIAVTRRGRILDVACGFGFQLLELSARGWKDIWGLEIDPNLSHLMAEAATQFGLRVGAQVGDACAIPFADGSFDAVMSKNFFEHVYDFDRTLQEQARVLKPKGRLIILDGNSLYPKALFDLLVLYPIRTRGQRGGLKWLFTKHRVERNLYGYLHQGRDEDIHTPRWWRYRIESTRYLRLKDSTTTGALAYPWLPKGLAQFIGACVVVAEKR